MSAPSGDAAFIAAARLLDALIARGVVAIVVSPGSRSTPLVLAAARQERVPVRVVLDERSAAFTALGVAKATGRPAAVICTSGTAAANHLPAAVEASMARVPLILLTADRPAHLRDTGANQTIDQRSLLGRHATFLSSEDAGDWATLGVEAFDAAMGPPARAVQVNLAFDEPLIPSGDPAREPVDVSAWTPPAARAPSVADLDLIVARAANPRGAIVAGPMSSAAPALADLARALAWPLLAEPAANLGGLAAAEQVAAAGALVPEVIIQAGTAPTTRAMQAFVARASEVLILDPDGRRQDGGRPVTATIAADPEAAARAVLERITPRGDTDWLATWERADHEARAALDAALDADPASEVRVARDVAAAVPAGSALLVGNSGPVRDLCAGMRPRADIRVLANRGASGIDGLVSTAFGIAWTGVPTAALLGDLSLLHDASGFIWGAGHGASATLIVLNNGGGAIFDRLPSATVPEHETYFRTPHAADLSALAVAAGARHVAIEGASGLPAALTGAMPRPGVDLIEVVA